ncbi:L-isoaspartyl protein carboxyl methyltransferase [Paraphysoderma sedebokerense]|nr:L-isoaspartyl protein carboxyl methyltransferase [Paraphysoderma sedebokerense]
MAWTCSGKSNVELITKLKNAGIITSGRVEAAMQAVDRKHYVPPSGKPYQDSPQSLGYSATISAPHMHAYALELLQDHLEPGMKALDVGSGSGYLTSLMAHMVGEKGKVVGIEHIDELVQMSIKNVHDDMPELLDSGRVRLVLGDGRQGYPAEAPYNAIHVGAAAPKIPDALVNQLAIPGRMVIPVGPNFGDQTLFQVDKGKDGKIKKTPLMGVLYVPLTDQKEQVGH